jgi:hypothetical protein
LFFRPFFVWYFSSLFFVFFWVRGSQKTRENNASHVKTHEKKQ